MKTLSIHLSAEGYDRDCWLLTPRPCADGQHDFIGVEFDGVRQVKELSARQSSQRAYLLKPLAADSAPLIRYHFESANSSLAEDFWQLADNRFTRASVALAQQARQLTKGLDSQTAQLQSLIAAAAEQFQYGHAETRFNDEHNFVPQLCCTSKGSCVDINTWLIATSRSLGIAVQYLAGYWFHPEKQHTNDMHCWLVFKLDQQIVHWDLAHHLKYGVAPLAAGLNPAGGRRLPMSFGRGLEFVTPYGDVTLSHFSEPEWINPQGHFSKQPMRIEIEE